MEKRDSCHLKLSNCTWPSCGCPPPSSAVRPFRETVAWSNGGTSQKDAQPQQVPPKS